MNNEKTFIEVINDLVSFGKNEIPEFKENELSDGYHTFNELYEFRKLYNALLFNEWAKNHTGDIREKNKSHRSVHKSKRHYEGEECFGGSWFIVVAVLPHGQISNHYKLEDWDLFQVPETEKALFPFDGHTPTDVLDRMKGLVLSNKAIDNLKR